MKSPVLLLSPAMGLLGLLALGAPGVAGCSDDAAPARPEAGSPDLRLGPDGPAPKKLTWIASTLDDDHAGKQAVMARGAGELGVAYYRVLAQPVTVTCPSSSGGAGTKKGRPARDLYHVRFDGSDWGKPVKVAQTIGPTFGLSIAMARTSGKAYIGYLGGKLNGQECSSSDAMIASSADGQTWSKQTLDDKGPIGDTAGHWMAVALDKGGQVHAAYRDVRYGLYEHDGETKASVRYDGKEVVAANNGAGVYISLAMDSLDQPVLAFYNPVQMGAAGGIQLAHKKAGTWTSRRLVAGATNERPDLESDGKGHFGLAYYSPDKQALFYAQSSADLTSWSDKQVDTSLSRNGEFSSVAFDSQGNPAISYYRCGRYGQSSCDFAKDGLMFAHRRGGLWKTYEVDTGSIRRCGTYTSLVFNAKDQPIIAYQCNTFDNRVNQWIDTLKVARGVYK